MPKLLIDEHPVLVLPSLAVKIGLAEALFLQQLHYWIDANGHLQDDGRRWIFNSYDAWSRQFPWWNVGTIRRIVATLRDAGLIETSTRFNRMGVDHTLWYTIDYTRLDQLTAPPSDPEPQPSGSGSGSDGGSDPEQPPPSDPEQPNPPAENDTSSAENGRRSAQNAQTIRAECADDPREMRATITRELLSETSPKTSAEKVVVVEDDLHQDPHSLPEKTRAPAREAPAAPLPTYDQANTDPAAIDAALAEAEILDPDTRQSILTGNPSLTVEAILAWDAYRTRVNATDGKKMGPGALVSLLRSAAKPPRSTTGPDAARFLIRNGFLAEPELPNPPIPADLPDNSAADLWRRIVASVLSSNPGFTVLNSVRPTCLTDTHLTLTAPSNIAAYLNSRRLSLDMLTLTASSFAGRQLTLTIQPHEPHPP